MMAAPANVTVECLSRERLNPTIQNPQRTIPLSVLDNTVVNFALTAAVWYFDNPSNAGAFTIESFKQSLQKTLEAYPQWAGQLHWLPYDLSKGQRHGRIALTFGSPNDPGVEFIVARCPHTLSSLVPSSAERVASGAWDASTVPSSAWLCPISLAPRNASGPCVTAQLTVFACGGVGLALRIAHCIADATAMVQFARDWAAVHRAALAKKPVPELSPVFDPARLDRAAFGSIKVDRADSALLEAARALPAMRFDWWASGDGCPSPMLPSTKVPAELKDVDPGPPGDKMPWEEWDLAAPVDHVLLYFSPSEVQGIWEAAQPSEPSSTPRVSRFDALLAFIWHLNARARGLDHDAAPLHMTVTLGVRARLSPPLPDAFLGSPITLARASLAGAALGDPGAGLAAGATAIRSAVARYTPAALGALLHEHAHEVNPQRTWRAFLGRRHAIVTSWQGLDVYGMDFGGGAPPRYVDAVMPGMDGCIHIMEAGTRAGEEGGGDNGVAQDKRRWYDDAVCVSLHLERSVMQRLLKHPELRRYDS